MVPLPAMGSQHSDAGANLECSVVGLGGPLCTVSLPAKASLRDLQIAIEVHTAVAQHSQRLFCGLRELRGDRDLAHLASSDAPVELSLVIRPAAQARWLEELNSRQRPILDWAKAASEEARADREVALAVVAERGSALQYLAPELQADREVVLSAVVCDGSALQFAASELRADRAVALAAVSHFGYALGVVAPELRADREVVLAAVARNGLALDYAAEKFQADRDIVLTAVAQWGPALEYAAPELRADREVALAALAEDGHALRFVAPELRADREVALAALAQDSMAIEHASQVLQDDLAFKLHCFSGLVLAIQLSIALLLHHLDLLSLMGVLWVTCNFRVVVQGLCPGLLWRAPRWVTSRRWVKESTRQSVLKTWISRPQRVKHHPDDLEAPLLAH